MAKSEKKESFEEALGRLEEIADKLEAGDLPLEEALKHYEDGVKAFNYCSRLLKEIEQKIEVLTLNGREAAPPTAEAPLPPGEGKG